MATKDDKERLIVEDTSKSGEHLPLWSKLCFAVGGAPYQMTNNVINFFINIFLLEVAQIRPSYVSVVVFGGKVWDAITDPVCGFLVSKTNTRFGKLRPWILFSAPFACTAYFFLWYVPDASMEGKLGWYFMFYCLFQGTLSGLHVPYTSLTMYISNSQKERDSATAYRMISEAVGVLLAAVVQGELVGKTRKSGDCEYSDSTLSGEELEDQKWAYLESSFVVIGIYIFCAVTVFFGVKEKKGVVDETRTPFFEGFKMVFTFRPYVLLSMSFLFLTFAVAIVQGNLALFCTHTLKMGDQFSTFMIVLLITSIVTMPLWQIMLTRFGKKTTYAAGMILFIPTLTAQLYIPSGNPYAYYPILVTGGMSVSVALLLPWSMLPDVLDEFMLTKGTRKDAIFYSFYVFFNKLATGLGIGVSQLALEFGGYKTGLCDQPSSVALTLRLLIVPGPVLFLLIALICLWKYPIDETRRIEIRKEVENRQKIIVASKHEAPDSMVGKNNLASLSYKTISVSSTEM